MINQSPKQNSILKPLIEKHCLSDKVKLMEEDYQCIKKECDEAKATCIINFGNNGWVKANIINHDDSLPNMYYKILFYLMEKQKTDGKKL